MFKSINSLLNIIQFTGVNLLSVEECEQRNWTIRAE